MFRTYRPSNDRYKSMVWRRCGHSGLRLPMLSLGLWHNFGGSSLTRTMKDLVHGAFDLGITHFDLANNYGPPPGSAETHFGRILKGMARYRDEMVIATKAGFRMGEGPYGDGGSRKYLLTSLDQSLKRLGVDHVDIFYHHRFDPDTPLEESMAALDHAVRVGKARYVGISNYRPEPTRRAVAILQNLGTPFIAHQTNYSMFQRTCEGELSGVLTGTGLGCVAFGALAQGLLSRRYFEGIPSGSRATHSAFLNPGKIDEYRLGAAKALDRIATGRGQTLAQMAVSWVLREPWVTTALVGASSRGQLEENLSAIHRTDFSREELGAIDAILGHLPSPSSTTQTTKSPMESRTMAHPART